MTTASLMPVFRTTSYTLAAAEFTGTTYTLVLDQPLADNYYVQVMSAGFGDPVNGSAALTADPNGTGDLATSGDPSHLIFTRGASSASWVGEIVVVESLRDHDTHGFRLLDAVRTIVPVMAGTTGLQVVIDGFSGVDQSFNATTSERLVLFGGARGAGANFSVTGGAYSDEWPAIAARIVWDSPNTLRIERYCPTGESLDAGTFTTLAVRFGSAWDVQQATITGTSGAAPPATLADWDDVDMTRPFIAENTWLHWTGYTESFREDSWAESVAVTLGDGVVPPTGSLTKVSAACGHAGDTKRITVWTLTHPDLVVYHTALGPFASSWTGATFVTSQVAEDRHDFTYTSSNIEINIGRRMCVTSAISDGTGTAFHASALMHGAPNGGASFVLSRSTSSPATGLHAVLLQVLDFGQIRVAPEATPTIRTSNATLQVASGVGSIDVTFPRDIQPNYFVMVTFLAFNATSGTNAPDQVAWEVIGDPFGTGGMANVGHARKIRLARVTSTSDALVIVRLFECMSDPDGHGFRLLGVETVGLSTTAADGDQFDQHTCSHIVPWTNQNNVVVYAGLRGGGASSSTGTSAAHAATLLCMAHPQGTNKLMLQRRATGANTLKGCTLTAYVVQWGSAWDVQHIAFDGHMDSAWGLAATLQRPVATANSMLHVWAISSTAAPTAGGFAVAAHLGNGATTPTTATQIALACDTSGNFAVQAVVVSHPGLRVSWINLPADTSNPRALSLPAPVDASMDSNFIGSGGYRSTYQGARDLDAYVTSGATAAGTWDDTGVGFVMSTDQSAGGVFIGNGSPTSNFGWAQLMDFTNVAQTASVVALPTWTDGGPRQWLLIPDPAYQGAANVFSVTDQGGRYAGTVVGADGNVGLATGLLEGSPTVDTALEFLCPHAGKLDGVAGILYRLAGDASYMGLDSPLHLGHQVSLWPTKHAQGVTVAWSSKFNRIIVGRPIASAYDGVSEAPEGYGILDLYYRDADANLYTWTHNAVACAALFDAQEIATDLYGPRASLDMCELDTGALLAVVNLNVGGYSSARGDSQILRSTDGGITWTVQVESLLAAARSAAFTNDNPQMSRIASVGPWVRICRADNTSTDGLTISTFVSGDGGSGWDRLSSDVQIQNLNDIVPSPGGENYDMIGLDDVGLFLLAMPQWYNTPPAQETRDLIVYYSSRDGDWNDSVVISGPRCIGPEADISTRIRVEAMTMVRILDHVVIMWWGIKTHSSVDTWGVFATACPISRVTEASAWFFLGQLAAFEVGAEKWPYRPKAVWAGNQLIIAGGLMEDQFLPASPTIPGYTSGDSWCVTGDMLLQAGGWSQRPWYPEQNDKGTRHPMQANGTLTMIDWYPPMGDPSSTVLPASYWQSGSFAGGVYTWSPEYFDLDAPDTTTDAAWLLWTRTTLADAERWGISSLNQGVGHAFVIEACVPTATSSTGNKFVLARIYGDKSSFTTRWDVSLQIINTTTLVVRDNVAAATLATFTLDLTAWREWRIHAVQGTAVAGYSSPNTLILTIASRLCSTGPETAWTEHGVYTARTGATHTNQEILFGTPTGAAISGHNRLRIRHVRVSVNTAAGQGRAAHLWTSPGSMLGAPTSRYPMMLRGGLYVRWGGMGMATDDAFTGRVLHTAGKACLSVDSPRIALESSTDGAWSVVLAAKPNPGTSPTGVRRMHAQALALIGTVDRTAVIEWGTSATDWSTPALQITANADILTGLRVLGVSGNTVQFERIDGLDMPKRGTLVGTYVQFTTNDASQGLTFAVTLDADEDGWWILDTDDQDLGVLGITYGTTAVCFGDRIVLRLDQPYRYPYLRVSFPDNDGKGTVLDGRHRIGAMVPGYPFDLEPTMEWTHNEDNAPLQQVYATDGGHTQVYSHAQVAPRTIEGKIVGNIQGDGDDQRMRLHKTLRDVTRYAQRPMVLVLNGNDLHQGVQAADPRDCAIYGRWDGGLRREQAAWYQDEQGAWHQSGDTDLRFDEVV